MLLEMSLPVAQIVDSRYNYINPAQYEIVLDVPKLYLIQYTTNIRLAPAPVRSPYFVSFQQCCVWAIFREE